MCVSEGLSVWLVFIHVIIPLATPGDDRLNNIQPNTSADCVKRRPLVDSTFIHSVLRPLVWVANVPCLISVALFIWSNHFEPVQSLRYSTHVRLGLFLVCLPVFLLFLSAEHHNVLMCFSKVRFSGCLFPLHHFSVAPQCLWYEKSN